MKPARLTKSRVTQLVVSAKYKPTRRSVLLAPSVTTLIITKAASGSSGSEFQRFSASASSSPSSSPSPASIMVDVTALKDMRYKALSKVLVAGATGGVGREVVKQLLDLGIPVRALVRNAERAAAELPKSPLLEIVRGDVTQYVTLPRSFEGVSHVVCATGVRPSLDPTGPFRVDYQGTANLVAAAKLAGVKKFVYCTSIGTDDPFFPLNAAWGVLLMKKQGEQELQRSGLTYTIVRPGGLLYTPKEGGRGNVVMEGPDTFGLPPRTQPGSILRSQVAEVMIEALVNGDANNKVVEVIADPAAPAAPLQTLFAQVRM